MQFVDRFLKCSDCSNDFVFTAGEQLFFFDKQFKNDPKRCKLCKAKRAGLGRSTNPNAASTLPYSRTETRTECSACGVETTVPFKPTQGRPVLCRSCFQEKRVPVGGTPPAAVPTMPMAAMDTSMANAAVVDLAMRQGTPQANLETALPAMEEPHVSTMDLIAEQPLAMLQDL